MPGGPTDPTVPTQAIQAGATWVSNHLSITGVAQWLAVSGDRWILSNAPAVCLDEDTFTKLRGATLRAPFVIVDGSRYQLDAVTVQGVTWAVLQPA